MSKMWLFNILIFPLVMSKYPVKGNICDKQSICDCHIINDEIHADCSHMNLTETPYFHPNVSHINLSYNKLSFFPNYERLPAELRYLDISNNRISRIQKEDSSGLKNLISLNMTKNNISFGSNAFQPYIFDGFEKLEVLNLKKTVNLENAAYPIALSTLIQLKELLIDGLDNAIFDKNFSRLIHLSTVDMSGITGNCHMTVLTGHTFQNLPFLKKLVLTQCNIKTIHENAFSHLKFLKALDISYNMLSFSVLRNISNPSIEILRLIGIHCPFGAGTTLTKVDAKNLPKMSLKELYADSNRLELCEPDVVKSFPKSLQKLSVSDNKLTFGDYALEVLTMDSLTWFDGSMQYRSKNPMEHSGFCSDGTKTQSAEQTGSNSSFHFTTFNSASTISILQLQISIVNFPLPKNIQTIFFNSSGLKYKIPKIGFYPNQLKSAYLQDNFLNPWIGPVFGLENLRFLDLSNNHCSNVSDVFFSEVPSIEILMLQGNDLAKSLALDSNGTIFSNLGNLSKLSLGRNKIYSLPPHIFKNAFKLRYLDLSDNLISTLEFRILHLDNLLYLDLSTNLMKHLSIESMSYLNKKFFSNNMSVNLMYNPIECLCPSLSFIEWMLTYNSSFDLFSNYSCASNSSEDNLLNLHDMHKYIDIHRDRCNSYQQKTEYVSYLPWIISCLTFGIITLGCMTIYIKYKTRLWYHFYKLKMKYWNYIPLGNEDDIIFQYDAYISFCNDPDPDQEEINFVQNDMTQHLEGNDTFQLCLPERDFQPGKTIFQCIIEAMIRSRLFVIILSPQYLKSDTCELEKSLALTASTDRKDPKMIHVIYYRKVEEMPLELIRIKNQRTNFLKYPINTEERPRFWRQLHERMRV